MLPPRPALVPFLALVITAGCSWDAPLRTQQVVTRDAYQSADETIQYVSDSFIPISVVELAARRGQPLRYPRGWLLIDDGGDLGEPAAGFSGSRAQLALALSERLVATVAPPPTRQAATGISLEIERVSVVGGSGGDLSVALAQLETRWPAGAPSPLLIFSRADRITEETVQTARRMRSRYGEGWCLHLISVGDKTACFKLRAFNTCGSAVRGEDIADPQTMAAYAMRLFYGDPSDHDGDGIEDYRDQCPDTPKGMRVNWDGCPFDEAALKRLLPAETIKGF